MGQARLQMMGWLWWIEQVKRAHPSTDVVLEQSSTIHHALFHGQVVSSMSLCLVVHRQVMIVLTTVRE
jgi:hypothetical protein